MNDRKYVKFGYSLDTPYCNFDEFELVPIENDTYFSEIRFKEGYIILYFKDYFILQENQNKDGLENYAENKIFAILLEVLKNSNAQNFELYLDESCIDSIKYIKERWTCSLYPSSSINFEMRRSDETIITEEENLKMILENNKKKMQDIISNSNNNLNIQEKDKEKFVNLFQVKKPVIKYFVLYSWLAELCSNNEFGSQNDAKKFIKNSNTFNDIGKIEKQRTKDHGSIVTEDIFTYLRNIIGHSINDILTINDDHLIQEINQYSNPLIKIILEKLNERTIAVLNQNQQEEK